MDVCDVASEANRFGMRLILPKNPLDEVGPSFSVIDVLDAIGTKRFGGVKAIRRSRGATQNAEAIESIGCVF